MMHYQMLRDGPSHVILRSLDAELIEAGRRLEGPRDLGLLSMTSSLPQS